MRETSKAEKCHVHLSGERNNEYNKSLEHDCSKIYNAHCAVESSGCLYEQTTLQARSSQM